MKEAGMISEAQSIKFYFEKGKFCSLHRKPDCEGLDGEHVLDLHDPRLVLYLTDEECVRG